MAEYIEREALLTHMKDLPTWDATIDGFVSKKYPAGMFDCEDVISSIENAAAADVVPVVHGRWVGLEYGGYADGLPVYDLWECSVCGEEVRGEDVPDTHPYCHGCGARNGR